MKKALLISSLLVFLVFAMNSCKKCSVCTITTNEIVNDKDSTIVLSTTICNTKNNAGTSYKLTIQDVEANGYICSPQ